MNEIKFEFPRLENMQAFCLNCGKECIIENKSNRYTNILKKCWCLWSGIMIMENEEKKQ